MQEEEVVVAQDSQRQLEGGELPNHGVLLFTVAYQQGLLTEFRYRIYHITAEPIPSLLMLVRSPKTL